MPGRKGYAGGAVDTTLSSPLNATGETTIVTTVATGWPDGSSGTQPYVLCIDADTAFEEKILCSARSGTSHTISSRAYDGSTAYAHSVNAEVMHCLDADTITEANAHVNDDTRDDHSQYMLVTGTRAFTGMTNIAGTPTDVGTSNSAGSGVTLARANHVHKLGTGSINSAGMFAAGVVDLAAIGADAVGSDELLDAVTFPLGACVDYFATSEPSGANWLFANGQAISRSTYSTLFSLIADTYGIGDGSTTFNLPDLRGRVSVPLDNMGGSDAGRLTAANTIGGTGGEETHVLTIAEMPDHDHAMYGAVALSNSGGTAGVNNMAVITGAGTADQGGGGAHNNLQPYLLCTKLMRCR